jgi:hypothetical protein
MRFAAISGQHFWSNGWAWGTCRIRREPGGQHEVELRVLGGALSLRRFELRGVGGTDLAPAPAFGAGAELRVEVNPAPAQPV